MNLPNDFTNRMKRYLSSEYDAFIASYERHEIKGLRINAIGEGASPIAYFDGNFQKIPWEENGFSYSSDTISPGKHPYHEAGAYYIQEPSAMAPVYYLDVKPGEKVLDLCASPGGKSTQIGSKMQNKGILVSNEINSQRAAVLSENIERMGIRNALVLNTDPNNLCGRFEGFFDKVLVDAPCSGEGMFRRLKTAIDEWSLDNVKMCAKRQSFILDEAAKAVRDGGTLVYSTCTFSREENEDNIAAFLERHSDFSLDAMQLFDGMERGYNGIGIRLYPHKVRGEGHYACRLVKNSGDGVGGGAEYNDNIGDVNSNRYAVCNGDRKSANSLSKKNLSNLTPMFSFFEENIKSDAARNDLLSKNISMFGDNIYLLPDNCPKLSGLKVMRAGLYAGLIQKGRFEPSHALAMSLIPSDFYNNINITDNTVILKYLRGETIDDTNANLSGWTLISYDGYSTGWGKKSNGIVKNHYPKRLRKSL